MSRTVVVIWNQAPYLPFLPVIIQLVELQVKVYARLVIRFSSGGKKLVSSIKRYANVILSAKIQKSKLSN